MLWIFCFHYATAREVLSDTNKRSTFRTTVQGELLLDAVVKQKIADGKRERPGRGGEEKGVQRQECVVYKCFRTADADIDQMFPSPCQIKVSSGFGFEHESSRMCSLLFPTLHAININTIKDQPLHLTCMLSQEVTICHLLMLQCKNTLSLLCLCSNGLGLKIILWRTKVLLIPTTLFERTYVPRRADCTFCDS